MSVFAHILKNGALQPTRMVRDYFAARVVYPSQLPSIMRKHIYTGAMGNIYGFLISGLFFVYFGTAVGLSQFQWGLMAGMSSFLIASQIFSALVTQRSGRRKLVWFTAAMADRGLRLAGIALAYLAWRAGWSCAAVMLIVSTCVSNFLGSMAFPPWFSWLADIIPEEQQGRFWGRRAAWVNLSVILVMVPAGALMDLMPEPWRLHAAMAVFALAGIVGIADLVIHGTIPEPPMALPKRQDFLPQLLAPLRDRGFRPWLVFNFVWTISMSFGGSLSMVHFVENLHLKKNFLGGAIVLTGCTLLGSMLTARWSGRLVDRIGPKRVLLAGHMGWALLPGFWLFATPETALVWLTLSSLCGGASTTAAANAATKLITRYPPAEHRAMYVAVSTCIGSLASGLGATAAGTVLKLLSGWRWEAGAWVFGGFHVLFAISLCLRVASLLVFIRRVQEGGAAS